MVTLFNMFSLHLTTVLLIAATAHADAGLVRIDTPMSPPAWALLERELLLANTRACEEFFARYFDERGYLLEHIWSPCMPTEPSNKT